MSLEESSNSLRHRPGFRGGSLMDKDPVATSLQMLFSTQKANTLESMFCKTYDVCVPNCCQILSFHRGSPLCYIGEGKAVLPVGVSSRAFATFVWNWLGPVAAVPTARTVTA